MAWWKRIALSVLLVTAIASGWVHSLLSSRRAEESKPPATSPLPSSTTEDKPQFFHGRITKVREIREGTRQCLVEYPRTNVYSKESWIDGMWFLIQPNTVVIDRRTGVSAELVVGKRVSVWFSGPVKLTDPARASADKVVIEPEGDVPPQP